MFDCDEKSLTDKVKGVVLGLLLDRALSQDVDVGGSLREAGLTSLDMVSLVLSIEAEFDLMIPENEISPANFRSIAAIARLVTALLEPT